MIPVVILWGMVYNRTMSKILKLPLDKSKRHFIVGDIHGRYQSFLKLLKEADYDEENDIIYSVGDMIDRGPKSYEVVEYFTSKPNAYSIMGNHEYMAISDQWLNVWLNNGGLRCLKSLEDNGKNQVWLNDKFENLPWIIEVGELEDEHCFRIVHADYEPVFNDQAAEHLFEIATDEDGEFDGDYKYIQTFIWSRATITQGLNNVANMKPIHYNMSFTERKRHNYVGHTPIRKITTVGDITFLDTWGSSTLSMIEAVSGDKFTTPMID